MNRLLCGLLLSLATAAPASAQRPTEARPLLIGDWPDPTICRDGADYYLTHSSGPFRPAALIWHSRDLQTWTPLTHAVPEQEGNVWVSELTKHEGRFHLYYSADRQVYVVTAPSAQGPWSKPIKVETPRELDVGHAVDDTGQRYLFSGGGRVAPLDPTGTRATAERQRVHQPWPIPAEWAIECECLESPRVERRGEWFYLIAAQGGTFGPATAHMAIVARARHPLGPWENGPHNPLIRTHSREESWWTKGHGDLIEGPGNQWWIVLHGHRAHHRTLGRCTLIEPVTWTADGWPRIAETWPANWQGARANLALSDDFEGSKLGLQWQFHTALDAGRFRFDGGALVIAGHGQSAGDSRPLCVMPRDESYQVETELEVAEGGAAGLMLFARPDLHLGLELGADGQLRRVSPGMKTYAWARNISPGSRRLALRITNRHEDVTLAWRVGDGAWQTLTPGYAIDKMGESLSGVRVALFAHGRGETRFHHFSYRPLSP